MATAYSADCGLIGDYAVYHHGLTVSPASDTMCKVEETLMLRGTFTAELTEDEASALMRPVVGVGGFQNLLRGIQKAFDKKARTAILNGDQIEKINRYTEMYGAGGFENRLDGVRRNLPKLLI